MEKVHTALCTGVEHIPGEAHFEEPVVLAEITIVVSQGLPVPPLPRPPQR